MYWLVTAIVENEAIPIPIIDVDIHAVTMIL